MTPKRCAQCGQPHAHCTAHRRDGDPCGMKPIRGLRVCRMHGGSTKRAKAKGKRQQAEDQAAAALARLLHNPDAAPVTDPVAALQRLAGVLVHAADALGARVNELEDRLRYSSDIDTEQIRGEVQVWRNVLKDTVDVCDKLAKLDLGGRAVQLQEAQLALLERAWHASLADPEADLPVAKQRVLQGVFVRHLRAIEEATA